MGALEYEPSADIVNADEKVDLDALTKLAADILSERESVHKKHDDNMTLHCLRHIFGTFMCEAGVSLKRI